MLDRLLGMIAPHYCYGCSKIGIVLCDDCKSNIVMTVIDGCIECGRPLRSGSLCSRCRRYLSDVWMVGDRVDVLSSMINDYKFLSKREIGRYLAKLLDARLPTLSKDVIIIPVPTLHSHVCQRGFDHTAIIARELAKIRGIPCSRIVKRKTTTKQIGANKKTRMKQAQAAFDVYGCIDASVPYLLIDDVYTSGATIRYAAKALKDAGAKQVIAGIVAHQPLDK